MFLEDLVAPSDGSHTRDAMANCWVNFLVIHLDIAFPPLLGITIQNELIRPSERSIHLYAVKKIFKPHLFADGSSGSMKFFNCVAA